jgi:flagellar biosynthetic protein FliP
MSGTRRLGLVFGLLFIFSVGIMSPHAAAAATSSSAATPAVRVQPNEIRITGLGDNSAMQIAILLTFLTLIPALVLCVTPFARLLVVFHFLRQALGLQTTPSNQTLIGLSLILTFFLMQPVGASIYDDAFQPYEQGTLSMMAAIDAGEKPLQTFMLHYVREKDLALFVELAKQPRPRSPQDLPLRIIVPAYILSELRAGFQIGAVLFMPFLVIDMVVASITTSIGMLQLPPVVISTPLKLLLFVMVDGWHLLVGSLMKSFA